MYSNEIINYKFRVTKKCPVTQGLYPLVSFSERLIYKLKNPKFNHRRKGEEREKSSTLTDSAFWAIRQKDQLESVSRRF